MSRIGLCTACEFGNHAEHVRIVQAVSEGVMGGVVCGCEGDCKGNVPESVRKILNMLHGRKLQEAPDA